MQIIFYVQKVFRLRQIIVLIQCVRLCQGQDSDMNV